MPGNVGVLNKLPPDTGIYDQLIDQQLHDQLDELVQYRLWADINELDPTELPDRVGELAGSWISRTLASVTPDD